MPGQANVEYRSIVYKKRRYQIQCTRRISEIIFIRYESHKKYKTPKVYLVKVEYRSHVW